MQIRRKITVTYVLLSTLSTLLVCLVVVFLFRQNNRYYFLKRLADRAKIVASIHYQNDPAKAEYYRNLKANGLEELINESDFVLPVNGNNTFEYNTKLDLPHEFYQEAMQNGTSWFEDDNQYYYGQLFNEDNKKYLVVITARDRRGYTTTLYMLRIFLLSGVGFLVLAYLLGKFFAKTVLNPVSRITKEANRIGASNLHNRLPDQLGDDEIADLTKTFNNMLDRLETSFEIQANFINNASHELKTPITTIIAESEIMLLKERETAEYIASLENIQNQATRLGNLTEGLLKLTQTGYDGTKQIHDEVRIDELLMDVKAGLDKVMPNNNIALRFDELPENEALLLLPCNRPLLELAISNLISNGVKYSDNGVVFVNLSANRSGMVISITDIGIGIPAEDFKFLFEPFFRGKQASKYVGYGLGLPLAFRIIKMHEGQLHIQSEPGKGTVVRIEFGRNIKNSNPKT